MTTSFHSPRKGSLALFLSLFSILFFLGCSEGTATLKILPLGDSITMGANYPGAYRIELERLLEGRGLQTSFVGSQSNGPESLKNKANEGHSGWKINQIAESAPGWIATYRPDIVLLMIGTNDIGLSPTPIPDVPAALSELSALVDLILGSPVKPRLILSSIPPVNLPWNSYVIQYNEGIQRLVQEKAGSGFKIYFNDAYSAMTMQDLDLFDGVGGAHPSATGYTKIGQSWFQTITAEL
jgi:lysophospholipase L1-like esterase